jgi:hypothetical protein
MAPTVLPTPRGPATGGLNSVTKTTIAHPALTTTRKAIDEEVRRTVLRESLYRYRRELMDTDERELLWDRIVRLRRQLKLA